MLAVGQRSGGKSDVTSPTFGLDPSPAWCKIGTGSAHATSVKSEPRMNMENAIYSVQRCPFFPSLPTGMIWVSSRGLQFSRQLVGEVV